MSQCNLKFGAKRSSSANRWATLHVALCALRAAAAAASECVCIIRSCASCGCRARERALRSVFLLAVLSLLGRVVCACVRVYTMRRRGEKKKGKNEMESTSFPISSFLPSFRQLQWEAGRANERTIEGRDRKRKVPSQHSFVGSRGALGF